MSHPTTLKELAQGRSDLFQIDPRKIDITDGFNVRSQTHIRERAKELQASIKEHGIRTPLVVRMGDDGRAVLCDGHCRLTAVLGLIEAGIDIKLVPCRPEPRHTTEEQRTLDLIIANDSAPLDLLEQGEVFKRLIAYQWTPDEIAKRSGKSRTHVNNCLALVSAPAAVVKAVASGKIAGTLVVELIRKADGDETKLKEQVQEAIDTAAADGKDHASRKHTNIKTAPPVPAGSQTPDWKSTPSGGSGGTGGGGSVPKLTPDQKVERLNKALEELEKDGKELHPIARDTAEAILNFLEGTTDIKPVKTVLLLSTHVQ